MRTAAGKDTFPRAALVGAATMLVIALVAAGVGRAVGSPVEGPATPVAERALTFRDRADGAVVVTQVGQTQPLVVETGENGFLRGTLRGLARERHREGLGPDAPFRLAAWADGRLTLADTVTGRRVELAAFGVTNEAVFARLLVAPQGKQP